jgi:hypothetical protein
VEFVTNLCASPFYEKALKDITFRLSATLISFDKSFKDEGHLGRMREGFF